MNTHRYFIVSTLSYIFLSFLLFAVFSAPYFAHAAEPCNNTAFCPLAEVGGTKLADLYNSDRDLVGYLNTLFKMAISAGAIIALLRLLYAGYMYMGSDVWSSKEAAKVIFKEVLLGLFLLLSIWIILKQINPNLLNLKPQISAYTPPPATQAAPGASTPPPGDNNSGCSLCVPIPSGVRSKPPGTVPGSSACRAYGGPCVVSPTMASKLQTLSSISSLPAWQITEAYPPTVAHSGARSCHNNGNGSCVDANFLSNGNINAVNINMFLGAASQANLTAKWEVRDSTRRDQLVSQGVPSGSILVTGNQEHFHITGG